MEESKKGKKVLLLIIILLLLAGIGFISYKVFILDNNVEEKPVPQNNESKSVEIVDTVIDYLKYNAVDVKKLMDFDFSSIAYLYDSETPESSELIYRNAMDKLKPSLIDKYGEAIYFYLYRISNSYVVTIYYGGGITEIETIMILDSSFKEIVTKNAGLYYSNDNIYFVDMECDFDIVDNIPKDARNNESHMVNKLYKIEGNNKSFVGYVKHAGSEVC